jgi:hypothetical protein
MLLVILVTALLAMPIGLPQAGAEPVIIDKFSGGVTNATIEYKGLSWNTDMAIEVPRGANILRAELVVEGMPGYASTGWTKVQEYSGNAKGDQWLNFTFDLPSNFLDEDGAVDIAVVGIHSQWAGPMLPAFDNGHLYTDYIAVEANGTQGSKVVDFGNTQVGNDLWARWKEGQGLYPPTVDPDNNQWKAATNRDITSIAKSDDMHWYTVTTDAGKPPYAWPIQLYHMDPNMTNAKSYKVIWEGYSMCSMNRTNMFHAEIWLYNHTGAIEYPEDLKLEIEDYALTIFDGNLTGEMTVGDTHGLKDAIQSAIENHSVRPGNLILPLNFSVVRPTNGKLHVRDLLIEYEPVVNEAPEYMGPESVDIQEDADWTPVIDLDASFTDDFNQGELLFVLPPQGGYPPVEWRKAMGTGDNWTLELKPRLDFFGEVAGELTLEARDLFGDNVSANLTINVLQTPDPPSIVDPGPLTATEKTTFSYTFEVSDPDLPDDAFTWSDDTDLFDVDAATGEIVWTPGPDQIGEHSFLLTAEDRFGMTDKELVRITVTNVNDPPSITTPDPIDSKQGEEATFVIRADDPDLPFGDELTYYAFADTVSINVDQTTGRITFVPNNDAVPGFTITLRVQDKLGEDAETELTVYVENVNDPPTLLEVQPLIYTQGDEVSIRLDYFDPDLGLPGESEQLTLTATGPELMWPDDEGWINFTADQSVVGDNDVVYTVTDSGGLSDSITISWTINNVNDAPFITTQVQPQLDTLEDIEFRLELAAIDPDGDPITWSIDSEWAPIDTNTGLVVFTPDQSRVGTHVLIITVSDALGAFSQLDIHLEVINVNDLPVILSTSPEAGSTFAADEVIEFTANATDDDGDALTYTWKLGEDVLGTGKDFPYDKLPSGTNIVTLVVSDGVATATHDIVVKVEKAEAEVGGFLIGAIALALAAVVAVALYAMYRKRSQAE